MKRAQLVGFILIAGLLAGLPATAQEKHGKGRRGENAQSERERDHDQNQGRRPDERQAFSDNERERIQGYCEKFDKQGGKHRRSLPPGLAKKVGRGGQLPPGWAERCAPGQIMPVEVYRECRPLPPELTVRLPVPPVGTVTVAVDGRVVRLLEATREILDVFDVHVRF